MSRVIFSSWAGRVVDNRRRSGGQYASVDNLELPLEYNGRQVAAFMSWNGFLVADERVDVVTMAHHYMQEVKKLACGECSLGYSGVRVIADTLARISSGQGSGEDIDLLQTLGSGIAENAKCDFCSLAVKPVLDTLHYYREAYLERIAGEGAAPGLNYIKSVTAPCMETCPARQDIPGYIELIKNYRYAQALEVIRRTNCLPGVTGRACVALCEANCVRSDIDSPLAIRALKRLPADYEVGSGLEPDFKKEENGKKKVAVIGAGPAGLAASYNLARKGYRVTVYDEQPSAGGMVFTAIPPYRLPKDVLSREAETIKGLGVDFKLNTRIGRDTTLKELSNQGFAAVFIATGAHLSRESGIENWSDDYEGLVDGVSFLHDVNLGKRVTPRDRVLIVGGGNTAIDCARTCLRLGFKEVTIVYRRSRAEMPAREEEVEAAEKEGAKLHFLALPVKVLTQGGRVTGAECIRMELGKPDASGRRRPIPVKGSEFVLAADMLLTAVGELPDLSFLEEDRIELTEWGGIRVEPGSYQTSQPWLFSGGDCVTGPATIIEAIAAGNRAARSIDQYLELGKVVPSEADQVENLLHSVALSRQRDGGVVARRLRQSPEQLSLSDRALNFSEVEKCFTAEVAIREAERCLRCYRVMLLAVS